MITCCGVKITDYVALHLQAEQSSRVPRRENPSIPECRFPYYQTQRENTFMRQFAIKSHGSEPVQLRERKIHVYISLIICLVENSCKIVIWCSSRTLVYAFFTLIKYRFRVSYYFFTANLIILCIATCISEITIAPREKEIWYMTIISANRVRFSLSFSFLSCSCLDQHSV